MLNMEYTVEACYNNGLETMKIILLMLYQGTKTKQYKEWAPEK